jgi:hypothetical protein
VPALDDASLAAASVSSARAGYFVLLWMLIGGIGYLVLLPFKRRVGAIDPRTGKPGGSEKAYVGTVWVVAALVTGLIMSR